jgi:peptide-methionine (S)-S-oxide reductase
MFLMKRNKLEMPGRDNLLPGRPHPILSPDTGFINGHGIKPPFPAGMKPPCLAWDT